MPIKARPFWDRAVQKDSGCWEWDGCRDKDGYGQYQLPKVRLIQRAHRVAFTLAKGEIPIGMVVCHSCDNPSCINPEHLFLGTVKDNNADRAAKGRTFKPYGNQRRYGVKDSELKGVCDV